ncbi:hypothetical protein Q5752_006838 [Cryptotrichosporon argae]
MPIPPRPIPRRPAPPPASARLGHSVRKTSSSLTAPADLPALLALLPCAARSTPARGLVVLPRSAAVFVSPPRASTPTAPDAASRPAHAHAHAHTHTHEHTVDLADLPPGRPARTTTAHQLGYDFVRYPGARVVALDEGAVPDLDFELDLALAAGQDGAEDADDNNGDDDETDDDDDDGWECLDIGTEDDDLSVVGEMEMDAPAPEHEHEHEHAAVAKASSGARAVGPAQVKHPSTGRMSYAAVTKAVA